MRTFQAVLALTLVLCTLNVPNANGKVCGSEGSRMVHLLPARGQQSWAVNSHRVLQSGVADCVWDGNRCNLRSDFAKELPKILGSPTTDSAKILASAALRAAVCSDFTAKSDCLEGASAYDCDWDTALSTCTLTGLLDSKDLRGVAFCPGSILDTAMKCFSRGVAACETATTTTTIPTTSSSSSSSLSLSSPSGDEGSGGTPLNCTLMDAGQLGWTLGTSSSSGGSSSSSLAEGLRAGVLGDRQLSAVLNSMLGTMFKYGMVGLADPVNQLLSGALEKLAGSVNTGNAPQGVCVAGAMLDPATMSSVASAVSNALQSNQDVLTTLISSTGSSTGSSSTCSGAALPLLTAIRDCAAATSSASCSTAASGGCQWQEALAACTAGPDLLPAIILDPSDRWVAVLRNATSICRSFAEASSCSAAVDISPGLQGGGFGSDGGGGAAAAVSASWWLLAAAAAAAAALADAVRHM